MVLISFTFGTRGADVGDMGSNLSVSCLDKQKLFVCFIVFFFVHLNYSLTGH